MERKRVKGLEIPAPAALQGSGVTQPHLPQGIGAHSGITAASLRCFKLQGANSGGSSGMKDWEGFEKPPCCGGLCTSVGAERPQPGAK